MGKRRISVFLFLLMFGLFAILNELGKPRLENIHKSDIVQLIASGLCFGFGFGLLFGRRKFLGE